MIFERGHFDSMSVGKSEVDILLKEAHTSHIKIASTIQRYVFLSHKHEDLTDVSGVIGLLRKFGGNVYIDSMDNKMPKQTTGDTAIRIKKMIKECTKFILLATDEAIKSFWCNWELGIGDTYKFIEHIAILPLKEKGSYDYAFLGNEYLRIYPKIEYSKALTNKSGKYFKEGFYVKKPIDKFGKIYVTELKEWLTN